MVVVVDFLWFLARRLGFRQPVRPAGAPPVDEPPLKGKYYLRTGGCTQCGLCCKNIFLIHGNQTIQTREQFEALRPLNPEYQYFKPMEATPDGLTFQCVQLKDDDSCAIYHDRPEFCRKYPTEHSLLKGGYLPEECGYTFTLLKTFRQVLQDNHERSAGSKKSGVRRFLP